MTQVVNPIKPGEVIGLKKKIIPPGVLAVFNELIAKNFDGRKAVVRQVDVIDRILATMDVWRSAIFEEKWLDVEDIYRAEGWEVEYDNPAYNENYPAAFTFTAPR